MGIFEPLNRFAFFDAGAGFALPAWVQWIGAILLGFGLAWTSIEIRAFSLKVVVSAIALLEVVVLSWVLLLWGILWSPFTTLTAGILGTVLGLVYHLSAPGRRRQALETVLGGRISRKTFRRWLDSNEPLPFEGEQREAGVVVCRVLNGTRIAQALPFGDGVLFSKRFLKVGSQTLKEAGGVLIEADAEHLVAAFGAVLPEPEHASQASEAALMLKKRLEPFCEACRERWNIAVEFGIAVHSGPVNVGAAENRFFVIGEPLDFARRLCEANQSDTTRQETNNPLAHFYLVRATQGE